MKESILQRSAGKSLTVRRNGKYKGKRDAWEGSGRRKIALAVGVYRKGCSGRSWRGSRPLILQSLRSEGRNKKMCHLVLPRPCQALWNSNSNEKSLGGFEQRNGTNLPLSRSFLLKMFSLFIASTWISHQVCRWPVSNIPTVLGLFSCWKTNSFSSLEYYFPDIFLSNWAKCPLTVSNISEGIAIIVSPLTKNYSRCILAVLKANEIMFYCWKLETVWHLVKQMFDPRALVCRC